VGPGGAAMTVEDIGWIFLAVSILLYLLLEA
jgi:hypothetical protein